MTDMIKDLSSDEIKDLIEQWVKNARDRRIVKRRLIDGIHYEDLSEEFGLSVRRLKDIVYGCEKTIRQHEK